MVGSALGVYSFGLILFLQEQIKDIIIITHSCPFLKLPLLDASVPSFEDRIQRWLWQ